MYSFPLSSFWFIILSSRVCVYTLISQKTIPLASLHTIFANFFGGGCVSPLFQIAKKEDSQACLTVIVNSGQKGGCCCWFWGFLVSFSFICHVHVVPTRLVWLQDHHYHHHYFHKNFNCNDHLSSNIVYNDSIQYDILSYRDSEIDHLTIPFVENIMDFLDKH